MRKPTLVRKFNGVNYPVFGFKSKPYNIVYSLHKIQIQKRASYSLETIDDKSLPGDYFSRLASLPYRANFDITCRNLQDIIFSRIKWGIDKTAITHDFSSLVKVEQDCRRVVATKDNLVWLHRISYPFALPTSEQLVIQDELYAIIVLVNNEWFIRQFTLDKHLKRNYCFI